jgi:hypothetical protein
MRSNGWMIRKAERDGGLVRFVAFTAASVQQSGPGKAPVGSSCSRNEPSRPHNSHLDPIFRRWDESQPRTSPYRPPRSADYPLGDGRYSGGRSL